MSSSMPAGRALKEVPVVATVSTPAPPRLRRYPIPKHEPRAASRVIVWEEATTTSHIQGTLALAFPQHTEIPDDVAKEPAATRSDRRRTGRSGLLPEPKTWSAAFIQAAMEVAGGLRSAGQLIRWTTPEVHATLVRRGALMARAKRGMTTTSKPRVRALITCAPRPGVCEVSAVIAEPDRVRAVAFRMEGLHGRWRVTDLEIG
jgi:uncharacterized protein DUF6459